jgi:hypothetical protein
MPMVPLYIVGHSPQILRILSLSSWWRRKSAETESFQGTDDAYELDMPRFAINTDLQREFRNFYKADAQTNNRQIRFR